MKILFLKGMSQYGAMRNYIDHWNFYCQQMGHETFLFDVESGYSTEQLIELTGKLQPELILCCNAIYAEIVESFMPKQCIYCTVLYDNPVVHARRLEKLTERSIVLSCDRFYRDFIREQYPRIAKVGFLPLSGDAAQTQIAYPDREIDLIFTGSYLNLNGSYEEMKNIPGNMGIIAENMAALMIEEPDLLLWQAYDRILAESHLELNPATRLPILNSLSCVELFVRAYVRDQVMLHIVDAGIPVHIFGNGWQKFHCRHPENLILHQGYGEVALKALGNSKISLNVMPWFRGGLQERNIAAMLSGAVSLTDSSRYLEEEFIDGEDIALYSLKNLEVLPELIQTLLCDAGQSAKIAKNGQEKAERYHTWKHRMEELLAFVMK